MIDDEFPEPHMDKELGPVIEYGIHIEPDYPAKGMLIMSRRIKLLEEMLGKLELITDREDCTIRYCPICSEYTEYPFDIAAHKSDCRLNNLLTSK